MPYLYLPDSSENLSIFRRQKLLRNPRNEGDECGIDDESSDRSPIRRKKIEISLRRDAIQHRHDRHEHRRNGTSQKVVFT